MSNSKMGSQLVRFKGLTMQFQNGAQQKCFDLINNHNQRLLMRFNRIKKQALSKLQLMDITNVFGSQQSESLTFKLPQSQVALNRSLIKEISQMKVTAAHYRMLYLTANQVQTLNRVFIINKNYNLGSHTNQAYSNPIDFQAYINPVIKETQGEKIQVEQSCLVIPFIKFIVPRYKSIKLQYRNEARDYMVEKISGQLSYWIQHCINHLDGELLFQYKLSQGKFCVHKDIAVDFPKTNFLLKEYSLRLKNHYERVSKGQASENDDQFIQMKQEYMQRLKYEYSKQNIAFSLKFQEKKAKII